jgi:hypothetical protein
LRTVAAGLCFGPRGTSPSEIALSGAWFCRFVGCGTLATREIRSCTGTVKNKGELPVIPVDARAAEVRAIKEG